jgi:hypothetical protein
VIYINAAAPLGLPAEIVHPFVRRQTEKTVELTTIGCATREIVAKAVARKSAGRAVELAAAKFAGSALAEFALHSAAVESTATEFALDSTAIESTTAKIALDTTAVESATTGRALNSAAVESTAAEAATAASETTAAKATATAATEAAAATAAETAGGSGGRNRHCRQCCDQQHKLNAS